MRTIFLGNETAYLDVLRNCTDLECIVGRPVPPKTARYFGSALEYADMHGIATLTPEAFLASPPPAELIISSGFDRLIPPCVIESPRIGIINIHASLLPAYRGRHPLNWAIINGEQQTGVTMHHVSPRMDEGDVIAQKPVAIAYRDNVMDVHNKIVLAGRTLLQEVLGLIGTAAFRGRPQDSDRASYYRPRKPSDGLICWRDRAEQIRNLVRALTEPYPGAFFHCNGRRSIVDEAECVAEEGWRGALGVPVRRGGRFGVRTGKGVLLLQKVREADMHHEEFVERSPDPTSRCREHGLA